MEGDALKKVESGRNSGITKLFMLIIVVILLLVSGFVLYFGLLYNSASLSLSAFPVEGIEIFDHANGTTVRGLVYVASTTQQQVQGFQNVTSFGDCNGLSKNQSTQCLGMIFVTTTTQNLCFWMHNTPLPLQQVWISSNGTVVYIYQAQPESSKTVCQTAMNVLETHPNITISLGDEIVLQAIS
jgi:uncharacterized membrane protein (UPF0127 family)